MKSVIALKFINNKCVRNVAMLDGVVLRIVKLLLTLLSILIIVVPIAFVVLQNKDDLLGMVVPPELSQIINGDSNGSDVASSFLSSDFKLPEMVGAPVFDPLTKTAAFTFDFTNPLKTDLNVNMIEGGIVTSDGVFLGNVSIKDPIKLSPGERVDITALGVLSDEGLNYLKNTKLSSVNLDLVDLNLDVAGITVHMDKQNIGDVPIPPELYQYIGTIG